MFNVFKRNKDFAIIFTVLALYYLQHLLTFRLGINFEEGRDANAYLLTLQGYVPYRDFEWLYGPFAFFVYPFLMKVFGINLVVLRLSYIILASFTIPLAYFLAKRIMPPLWAGIAAFLSILLFDLPYYTFNHVFSVIGGLVCLLMVCRFQERNGAPPQVKPGIPSAAESRLPTILSGRRDKRVYLLAAGVASGVVILTKPLLWGCGLLGGISLFLLMFGRLGKLTKRVSDVLLFLAASGFWFLLYLIYFYSQTNLKGIAVAHALFAPDSALFTDQTLGVKPNLVWLFFKKVASIFPIYQLREDLSLIGFKKFLVTSFDSFIFILPFLASTFAMIIYAAGKDKRKSILLFSIPSIFISLEALLITHMYGRTYIMQAPFILTAYLLYFLTGIQARRQFTVKIFIALFLFYLTFLHFFYYPYSMLKKYTSPLKLKRAGGILLTDSESKLYESLAAYLSLKLAKSDTIVVLDYLPQVSFLTGKRNIFYDDEYVFKKLNKARKLQEAKLIALFEDKIIAKIDQEKPRVALLATDDYSFNFKGLSAATASYLERNYRLDKIFGPADLYGLGGQPLWVEAYLRKESG